MDESKPVDIVVCGASVDEETTIPVEADGNYAYCDKNYRKEGYAKD